jgi:hypothetical protein
VFRQGLDKVQTKGFLSVRKNGHVDFRKGSRKGTSKGCVKKRNVENQVVKGVCQTTSNNVEMLLTAYRLETPDTEMAYAQAAKTFGLPSASYPMAISITLSVHAYLTFDVASQQNANVLIAGRLQQALSAAWTTGDPVEC